MIHKSVCLKYEPVWRVQVSAISTGADFMICNTYAGPVRPRPFFFITLKPRVEGYTQSMRLKYEPASEPLHISVK